MSLSPWRVSAFALTLLLPVASRTAAFQASVQQFNQGRANELELTAGEEKDSYEIYSMLVQTEMPTQWNITRWAISQETQISQNYANSGTIAECLQPSQDRKSIYLSLIEDYVVKNRKKLVLERKFDLLEYILIPTSGAVYHLTALFTLLFHVSAVGFNRQGTRALVYVGHNCGSPCGGGGYHFLVKKDGKWQVDREYRGLSCMWEVVALISHDHVICRS